MKKRRCKNKNCRFFLNLAQDIQIKNIVPVRNVKESVKLNGSARRWLMMKIIGRIKPIVSKDGEQKI